VKAFIGLRTNPNPLTKAQWKKHLLENYARDAQDEIRRSEKKETADV